MKKAAVSALAAGILMAATVGATQAPEKRDVAQVFAETCASCHGATLQGGQAASLLDDAWMHGGDDPSLARSIREGRADAGMPAFGGALSEQEIRALVIFIREKVDEAKRAQIVYAKPAGDTVVKSEEHAFRVETVTEGLETPWSIAFLPDGRMLVAEKPGRLRVVEKGKLLPEAVAGVPPVWSEGQGGLLDVAVHPEYVKNGWIYLSLSDPGADGTAMAKVVRGRLREGRLTPTAACPRTTRSRSRPGRCRRSGATATATRRASRSTPRPARSTTPSTGRAGATSSTWSSRAGTTVGRSSPTG